MRKWIYFVPFLSAPGRSTLHYSQRATDLDRLKRNMDDGTIVFLTLLLTALT